jgi:hypothetical protein
MKLFLPSFLVLLFVSTSDAFLRNHITCNELVRVQPLHAGYVPDVMDPDQWRKLKENEMNAKRNKNLGAYGPSSFKSRSLQAFQKDLEKGKVCGWNLFWP